MNRAEYYARDAQIPDEIQELARTNHLVRVVADMFIRGDCSLDEMKLKMIVELAKRGEEMQARWVELHQMVSVHPLLELSK